MGRNRKTVLKGFGYLRCDDFAAYLTKMSAKGWHFKQWGAGLVFEKGEPENVQYAVEVFIDGSEYDTRPDVHTQEFAEYCEAAGWKLLDAKRKFVIFKKMREDAVDILTPRERLENIAKEERKEIFHKMLLSYGYTILQLFRFTGAEFANRIFSNGLLMISAVWFSLAICATARLLHYLIWKMTWTKKIENGQPVYFGAKKNLFTYANGWYSWSSTGIILAFVVGLIVSEHFHTLAFALAAVVVLVVMAYLIARFRPDAGTNQIIQVIVSMILVMAMLTASTILIFTEDKDSPASQDLPLYYEDIGGDAGEIEEAQMDQSSSIFGNAMRCWINYEGELIAYSVYISDQPWILDTIWKDEMKIKINQSAEDVTKLWGATKAIRNVTGKYLVRYQNAILILDFAEDTVLLPDDVEVIRAALLESR